MKVINAIFFIKAEQRENFLADAKVLLASARAEEGCLAYELYESFEEANKFVMVENWRDAAAIEAHNQTPALLQLFKAMPTYAAKETIVTVSDKES